MKAIYKSFKGQFGLRSLKSTNTDSVYQAIIDQSNLICMESVVNQKIEDKIIISLGMRLCVEKYLYHKILLKDKSVKNEIKNMQLGELFHKYETLFPAPSYIKDIIKKVIILTPYHIHINSFMFEPMIDVSIVGLRNLYTKVTKFAGKF